MTARSATPATIHGSRLPPPDGAGAALPPDIDVPQELQNWAPGVSAPPQCGQAVPPRLEPQFEQNFPEAASPQRGQTVDMGSMPLE
jgi:hypothetical protein